MLPAEIQQIWLRPKSLRTIVFISLRYTILLGQFIQMIVQFIPWNELLKAGEITYASELVWTRRWLITDVEDAMSHGGFQLYSKRCSYFLLPVSVPYTAWTISDTPSASASFRIYAVSTDYKLLKAGTVLVIGTISAASDAVCVVFLELYTS